MHGGGPNDRCVMMHLVPMFPRPFLGAFNYSGGETTWVKLKYITDRKALHELVPLIATHAPALRRIVGRRVTSYLAVM